MTKPFAIWSLSFVRVDNPCQHSGCCRLVQYFYRFSQSHTLGPNIVCFLVKFHIGIYVLTSLNFVPIPITKTVQQASCVIILCLANSKFN